MQRHWSQQELETYWSFSSDKLTLIPDRDASSRLGVAASLKFLQLEGSFPSSVKDIPSVAIDHMAKRLNVDPDAISDYDWQGRTGTRYRGRLRTALGIRPSTVEDFKPVEEWLRQEVVPWDHDLRHLQDAMHEWYRSRLIEPPTEGRIERLVRSAVRAHEVEIFDGTTALVSYLISKNCMANMRIWRRRAICSRCCQALSVMSTEPAEEPYCDVAKSILPATLDTAPGGPSSPRGALRTPGVAGR